MNPSRLAFLDVLRRMGADISSTVHGEDWEPRGTVTARAATLRPVEVEPAEVPGVIDELPVLMAVAAVASGVSRFRGVAELRVKETDRVRSMVEGLSRLGARIQVEGEEAVVIEGGRRLTGADVDCAGDHRTAMSLAVAGLAAAGPSILRGAEFVAKSFPGFFDALRGLGAVVDGKKR